MPVKVLIPTALRAYAGAQPSVEVPGRTVGELLANLAERYVELRPHLYNEDGKLRSYVNIYVNDEDYRYLQRESTPVDAGDVVSIVPSIAGGQA